MEDFKILNQVLPVITVNFDQVQSALQFNMEKYKNLVVTKETLPGCKQTQKELAGLRIKINEYKVEKKKILSAPIVEFENQCKDLIALIEKVEEPLKEGIKVFDDKKRAQNRERATKYAEEMAIKHELREKYAKGIVITDKHCQISASVSEVNADIERQAFEQRINQNHEDELLSIIASEVEAENQRLSTKLPVERFTSLFANGLAYASVLREIRKAGDSIFETENAVRKEVELSTANPSTVLSQVIPDNIILTSFATAHSPTINPSPEYRDFRIFGSFSELSRATKLLGEYGFNFEVL